MVVNNRPCWSQEANAVFWSCSSKFVTFPRLARTMACHSTCAREVPNAVTQESRSTVYFTRRPLPRLLRRGFLSDIEEHQPGMSATSTASEVLPTNNLRQRNTANGTSKLVVSEEGKEADRRLDRHDGYVCCSSHSKSAITNSFF